VSDIQRESQAVLDNNKENDYHGAFKEWKKQWDRCICSQGDYFEGMIAKIKLSQHFFFDLVQELSEAGRVPGPVWTLQRMINLLPLLEIKPRLLSHPAQSLLAKHPQLPQYCLVVNIMLKTVSIIMNKLTSWSRGLLEKPPAVQLVKKFPAFYGTQRFITIFTRAHHWSLS
jgi:hypothetical protein